jgi:hypothetical protein
MNKFEAAAKEVAPWLRATDELEGWLAQRSAGPTTADAQARLHQPIDRLRHILQTLARCGEAIPAEVPIASRSATLDPLIAVWHPPAANNHPTMAALRADRDAVLRLAVWRVLVDLRTQASAQRWDANPFETGCQTWPIQQICRVISQR